MGRAAPPLTAEGRPTNLPSMKGELEWLRFRARIGGAALAAALALLAQAAHAGAQTAAGDLEFTCPNSRGLQGMLAEMADGMAQDGEDAVPRGTAFIEEAFCREIGPIECEAWTIELCRAVAQFEDVQLLRQVDARCGTALAFAAAAFLKESELRPHCDAKGLLDGQGRPEAGP